VIARLGRLSDLIVIARAGRALQQLIADGAGNRLVRTGRPVLMVPDKPAADLFHRPLIAWNGSLEAARAVGFALPFSSKARAASTSCAPERKHRTETEGAALLERARNCRGAGVGRRPGRSA
jgi:hypothetical protein